MYVTVRAERRLREVASFVSLRLPRTGLPGRLRATVAGLGLLGVGAAAEERERVGEEQRRAEREHELAEHLVVEAARRREDRTHRSEATGRPREAAGAGMPDSPVRLLVARCSVTYEGRLGARLAPRDPPHPLQGRRLDRDPLRREGVQAAQLDEPAVHDRGARRRDRRPARRRARRSASSCTRSLHDTTIELGDDPGLEKDGVEAELQQLLAARVAALRDDFTLVRREYPTDIGPIDLLCRDGDGRTVVVEVKRVGEIAGVDQLLRYQERLDRDPQFAPTVGMFVAQQIKPQAKVYAESKGVACVEIDLDALRGDVDPDLKLF